MANVEPVGVAAQAPGVGQGLLRRLYKGSDAATRERGSGLAPDDAWGNFKARLFTRSTEVFVLAVFAFMLSRNYASADAKRANEAYSLLVFVGCLLPIVFSHGCSALINRRAVNQRFCFELPSNLSDELSARVQSTWNYEIRRSCRSLSRAECFASVWGLTTTLVLIGAAELVAPVRFGGLAVLTEMRPVALGVIGAAATAFALDFVRIAVRTANDDATKRMFAEALRGLVLSVVVTFVLMLLPNVMGVGVGAARPLGIGIAAAIVGGPAFEFVRLKVMAWLKIDLAKAPVLTPLNTLTGISDQEITRLSEEGIESIEALVDTPIPRLFLCTRLPLRRLCDWVDRGVLLCHLGVESAAKLKDSTGIVRASELKHQVKQGEAALKRLLAALQRAMHLEISDGAAIAAEAIAEDATIDLLQAIADTAILPPANVEVIWRQERAPR
jgi:hypothetical protein